MFWKSGGGWTTLISSLSKRSRRALGYTVQIERRATKELRGLPKRDQARLIDAIESLSEDPRPSGVKKYRSDERDIYRLRVGNYRVVYVIDDDRLLILVVRLGHRKDVYRRRS